jgi:hypothetical protein
MTQSAARPIEPPSDAAAEARLSLALRALRAYNGGESTRQEAHVLRREVIEASVALERMQRR